MKDKTAIPTATVAKAIRGAFHRAGPCHCETVGKLGEEELLVWLIGQGVLSYEDVGPGSIPVAALEKPQGRWGEGLPGNVISVLECYVTTITELSQWTLADLVSLPSINLRAARRIGSELREHGLSLKDDDGPEMSYSEPAKAPPLSDANPEEIRIATSRALIDLSASIGRDSASVIRFATDLLGGKTMAGRIKTYASRVGSSCGDDVRRVAAPLFALEERDRKPARKAKRRAAPVQKRALVDNVVRPAFAVVSEAGHA